MAQKDRYTATRLAAELGLDGRRLRDVLTRVNPIEVKGKSKLYLLRDVLPHVAKYIGAPDVIDLNVERARKMKAEAELAEMELAKLRGETINVEAATLVWAEILGVAKNRLLSTPAKLAPIVAVEDAPAICKALIEEQVYEVLDELAQEIAVWSAGSGADEGGSDGTETAAEIDDERVGRQPPETVA
tara:strand:+ start:52 stop:612 length:561 start_codon:yes stop_codon:yes gene_type:complete